MIFRNIIWRRKLHFVEFHMTFSAGWDFGAVLRRRLVRVEGGFARDDEMTSMQRQPQFADCLNRAFADFVRRQIGCNGMRASVIVYGIA